MVGYLELYPRNVHTVSSILKVQQQHSLLRILLPLVTLLVVRLVLLCLVLVIHSGLLHITLVVLVELLVLFMSPLLQQHILDLEVSGN